MRRSACLLAALLVIGSHALASAQDKRQQSPKKLPDGVYAVLRESLKEKDVVPLKDGEVLVAHRYRYLKKDDKEPPRFLVVRSIPDVDLALARAPTAVKDGEEVVRILLKLQPKAAAALERLTSNRVGRQVTIVLGGEVVTMHKIREVIKDGEVQITSCAAGAANYLLEQLQAHQPNKSENEPGCSRAKETGRRKDDGHSMTSPNWSASYTVGGVSFQSSNNPFNGCETPRAAPDGPIGPGAYLRIAHHGGRVLRVETRE